MDLGDPRESLVSLNDHATWEADNRVEERWQWGAQILDLCNLSPEDYKNSTQVTINGTVTCSGCSGGGGNESGQTTTSNVGKATLEDDGTFKITFNSPVDSDLYVFGTIKDADGNVYTFETLVEKGSKSATYDVSELSSSSPYSIEDIKLNTEDDESSAAETVKDDKYEYSADYTGNIMGKTYVLSILCTETDGLTGDDYLDIINAQGQGFDYVASYDEVTFAKGDTEEDAVFYAPCSYVDHWMNESEEEAYFSAHSFDFIVLTEENVIDIKEDFSTDTNNWVKSSITIAEKSFTKWMRRDLTGAQCPYSIGDNTCEDYELTYTLKIKQN